MPTLAGTTSIITGVSTGIGRATAATLARAGSTVVLAARTADRLEVLAEEIRADGGSCLVVPTDVTDQEQVEALVNRTIQTLGGIDVLVNNAGVGQWDNTGISDADLDQWTHEIEVNLLGLTRVTRLVAPHLRDGGHVVNISSGADRGMSDEYPAYVTSKWGVRGFSGSAWLALRQEGIRVAMISPGEVDTPIQPEGEAEKMRMLDPQDVADAIEFVVTRPRHVSIFQMYVFPSGIDD